MKKFKIKWTKSAETDLELIIEYIKLESPKKAKEIFVAIKKECSNLYFFPEIKRIVPELQQIGIFKYRELFYKRWRILFKIEGEIVYILLMVDESRDLEDILFQRLIKSTPDATNK